VCLCLFECEGNQVGCALGCGITVPKALQLVGFVVSCIPDCGVLCPGLSLL
jgi:hypothetical protein